TTTIRYDLPKDGLVQLEVFDIIGRKINTIVNTHQPAGRYEVNFDASKLASGVYIYKLQSGQYISSKKMMLLK
ncbi:MAG: T9SS type A sorting domain-containing protein, partial [Ignavibacterium sp.]